LSERRRRSGDKIMCYSEKKGGSELETKIIMLRESVDNDGHNR
jgi:hypothetical protein